MATIALNNESGFSLGNVYMNMMRHLSDETKLEIINLLSASILHKEKLQENKAIEEDRIDLYSCFQGDWGSNMKTEDYCNELRRDLIPAKEIDL